MSPKSYELTVKVVESVDFAIVDVLVSKSVNLVFYVLLTTIIAFISVLSAF